MAIVRPVPKIYDFIGAKRAELHSAYGIVETKQFGQMNMLSFKYSYYLIDGNGNTVYDENGLPQEDPRIGTIINEFLVEFNDEWYIIKNVEEGRNNNGTKFIEVTCNHKSDELTFKQIRYINLTPPIHAPVDAKQAILEAITYPYQIDLGYGKITAASGSLVTLGVTTTFDFTGYKLVTLEGTGKYQQRKIVSYNTTTKQATLDSAFSPQVDTTTVFRVHNSKYILGYVDPLLINDGVADIFRSFKFEDVSINDALQTIATRFTGFLKFNTTFGGIFNEFTTAIDLRLPNTYNNFEFRYKKNLKGVRRIIDSTNGCYTRLYPEGRNNLSITSVATKTRTDSSITYNEHELGKGDIYNFQYYLALGYTEAQCRDLFIRDFRFIEEAYTDANMLYDGAKKALEDLSLPSITYEVEGVDLSVIGATTGTFNVGDTVQVVDTDLGFDFRATVVSKETDYDTPFAPRIVLSNFTDKFGDLLFKLIKYQEAFSNRKSLYGKAVSVVIADEATSRNWRYADYVIPADGSVTADYIINAAITEVSDLGGGEVVLMDGRFKTTSILDVKDNVLLYGAGSATIIEPYLSDVSIAIRVNGYKNIEIKNLFINYTDTNKFLNGIAVYSGSDNIKLSNIIQEFTQDNMFLAIQASNITVDRCLFKSDIRTFAGSDIIDVKACENATVTNNVLSGKLAALLNIINITNQVGSSSGEMFVNNNYIFTTEGNALNTNVIAVRVDDDAVVEVNNNTIITQNCTVRTAISTNNTDRVNVSSNKISATCSGNVIWVGGETQNPTVSTTRQVIENNVLLCNVTSTGTSRGGIVVHGSANDARIQNNTIRRGNPYNTSVTTLEYGIVINAGANRTLVDGNDVYLSGTIAPILDNGTNTRLLGGNKTA